MNNLSVIIPSYNSNNWLRMALTSLRNTNYPIFETIIIDDCSTQKIDYEDIKGVYKELNIQVIKLDKNRGAGVASHAEGRGTIAAGSDQHVEGRYNIEDTEGTYAHIVGGGLEEGPRKNIYTLDWSGNATFAGTITIGNTTITEAQLQALLALL